VSSRDDFTTGWFISSDADWLFYYFEETGQVYTLVMKPFRNWLIPRIKEFRRVEIENTSWTAVGHLVPIDEVPERCILGPWEVK